MPKCSYCQNEINIEDFFSIITRETRKGKIRTKLGDFKGQSIQAGFRNIVKMWSCTSCDSILGFSEYKYDSDL